MGMVTSQKMQVTGGKEGSLDEGGGMGHNFGSGTTFPSDSRFEVFTSELGKGHGLSWAIVICFTVFEDNFSKGIEIKRDTARAGLGGLVRLGESGGL